MHFRTRHPFVPGASCLALAVVLAGAPRLCAQQANDLAITWERLELSNGLEVVLLPDAAQREVAVELWTHVGTRHEPVGKYGLAHFFEHVMPYGPMSASLAIRTLADSLRTDSNARTRYDYTRYYKQTVSEGASLFLLEAAGRLASSPAIDLTPERVEVQRERVLAEMGRFVDARWGEPVRRRLARGTFGAAHPYGHAGYGTPEETMATTRDDLVRWQRAHVRPEYSTLFVAGNFDPDSSRGFIESVFGRIPGGIRPPREVSRVPSAAGGRDSLSVAADQSLLLLAWPIPEWASETTPLLQLLGYALGARLETSTPAGVKSVSVEVEALELAGSFTIVVEHEPALNDRALEAWAREELAGTLESVSEGELEAARDAERRRVRGFFDDLGWIGGRIELVGESLVFAGDPGHYLRHLARQQTAGAGDVREATRPWLTAPAFVLAVRGIGEGAP